MRSSVSFVLDGRVVTESFTTKAVTPTTTLLQYLRTLATHKGVKEGCAEGDCGACTIVLGECDTRGAIRYKAVDSCLVFLPMIHGRHVVTVENLRNDRLHPVQRAIIETGGSQCGFCTPGIVMSLFALYKNHRRPERQQIDDALTGNLCRCTGYRPIVEAAAKACADDNVDTFAEQEAHLASLLRSISHSSGMFETAEQTYFQPTTLGEALVFKRTHPDAVVLCGATDVALRVTKAHDLLRVVLDLSRVAEVHQVVDEGDQLQIGAGVTLSELRPLIASTFPALAATLDVFGSLQIRNLATLGGNLGSASPIGDTLSVLIPHHASVVLQNHQRTRTVPLDAFIIGYRTTALQPDELITAIVLPKPEASTIIKWYKVSKRKDLDISTVSAGFRLRVDEAGTVDEVVLAYGGMAERTTRASNAERFLKGKRWSRETVEQAMGIIGGEFTPITDVRGSAAFRTIVAQNLLLKFWSETQFGSDGQNG